MHLLYLDDAGSAANVNEEYLVLGGISVFEAQAHWFTQELDQLAMSIDSREPHGLEFHASEIFGRRTPPCHPAGPLGSRLAKELLQELRDIEGHRAEGCR